MTAPVDTWRHISPAYFDLCLKSGDRPHRQPILDAIESLMPAKSLLEIGCNAGINLKLIRQRWPFMSLSGLDANATAVAMANTFHLQDQYVGDLRDYLPKIEAGRYDVLLTSYCLAYIEPGQIADVLAHMVRIARVGLVIAEPMVWAGDSERVDAGIPEWRHNYSRMSYKWRTIATVSPLVERLNAVLTVKL